MATSDEGPSQEDARGRDTAERLSRLLAELAAPPTSPGAADWEETLAPGERLDRFEIRSVLGRGGFGTVYEAWDGELGRAVALKTLRPARANGAFSADVIKREAEAVAKLNHPGIVTLHDVCQHARGHYLVMERLEGVTLAERVRGGPLSWREAVRVAAEIAAALAHAHGRGVLHRDLKPANVFLADGGRVKLLDFGLAHLLGSGAASSGGTPAYMAPEQARGELVNARADVYALGVVLAEMLTGAVPQRSGGRDGARAKGAVVHRGDAVGVEVGGAPRRLPGLPARLAKLVARMLSLDASLRPADGAEVAAELAAFARSLEGRRRAAWIAGAVAACAVAVAVALALQPARLPAGRLTIAVADVDNQSGDVALDGVGALLATALEQSRRVGVVERGTLVRYLTKDGSGPSAIREVDAVAAARAGAAQLVLVPSVRRAPGGFELAIQVIDVVRGRALLGAREKAAALDSLYSAVDRLAARVRRSLAEDEAEAPMAPTRVADFAPANAAALQAWAEGDRLYAEANAREALPRWHEAIALEPSFPLPRLSILQASLGTFGWSIPVTDAERADHVAALRRDIGRLPDGVRQWAEFVLVSVEGGYENHTERLAALDAAITARPQHFVPYFEAINVLMERGDAEAARPYLDRVLPITPIEGYSSLTDYLVLAGRLDEAAALVRRWSEQSRSALSLMNLCVVHGARGETEAALAAARALSREFGSVCIEAYLDAERFDELDEAVTRSPEQGPGIFPSTDLVQVSAMRGRVTETVRLLRDAPRSPVAPESAAGWPTPRAWVLLLRGDHGEAERLVKDAILRFGPSPGKALLLAEAGNVDLAAKMVKGAPAGDVAARLVSALSEWKASRPEAALARLAVLTSPTAEFYRGAILAELGRHSDAAERFQRYRRLRAYGAQRHWFLPRSLYLEAVSREAMGEREEARRLVARLLRLWEKADPDLPLLAQARALERRLGGG